MPIKWPQKLFGRLKTGHLGSLLGHFEPFFGTLDALDSFYYTQKIITTNYPIIKSQKMELKWAKLSKNDHFEGHF